MYIYQRSNPDYWVARGMYKFHLEYYMLEGYYSQYFTLIYKIGDNDV
jgi:hypothetical protein